MHSSQLYASLQPVWHAIIPPADQRIPITFGTALQPLLCYLPFLYLCYLARRQNTFLARVLLLPIVVLPIVASAYRYTWTHPALHVYNWGQGSLAILTIARALDIALTPQGILKYGETLPGISKGKRSSKANGHHPDAFTDGTDDNAAPRSGIVAGLADALDLAHTYRGLSYKFSQGAYVPPHTRPLTSKSAFLAATLRSLAINYLVLDIIESIIKVLPNGIGTVHGGSMFLPPTLIATPWARYAVSTFVHLLTGSALMAGFQMVYELIVLIAVGLFNSPPASWPPLMDSPFTADSMHSFWGRRWHQLLRRPLVVLGGIPASWIAGDIGLLCGTFLASGAFHEGAMTAMDRGVDLKGFLFFAIQGPILILERLWRQVTGRRVHGWLGRLWVYTVIFILGQPLSKILIFLPMRHID